MNPKFLIFFGAAIMVMMVATAAKASGLSCMQCVGGDFNKKATDPNPPEYMKFHRMKWMYNATQTYQKWRAEWGELLMNDEDGTHRVFPVQRDYAVEEFLKDKKNYNKTLGTEEDNIAFWVNAFVKEDIIRIKTIDGNEQKKCFLNQNVGFGKHDFTAETLEESIEKAEKFLEDKKKEYLKEIGFLSESERTQREKVGKKKKKNRKKIETQKAEDLKKEEETVQPVEQEEEVKEEKNEDKKKEDRKEEEFKKEPEFVQPVKQEEEKTIKKKEEKKEEKKKKKNPCCSIM